jgi:hypothetical protein
MAFKLAKNPTFSVKVEVMTPNDRAGFDRSTLVAKFRRPGVDESIELQKLQPREAMEKVLVGWDDFLDDDDQPVPFGPDTVWAILSDPAALIALNDAFWATAIKAKTKN